MEQTGKAAAIETLQHNSLQAKLAEAYRSIFPLEVNFNQQLAGSIFHKSISLSKNIPSFLTLLKGPISICITAASSSSARRGVLQYLQIKMNKFQQLKLDQNSPKLMQLPLKYQNTGPPSHNCLGPRNSIALISRGIHKTHAMIPKIRQAHKATAGLSCA